jgi:hypothetical protein
MLYAIKTHQNSLKYGLCSPKMRLKSMVYGILESYGLSLQTKLVDAESHGFLEVMGCYGDGL